MSGERHYDQKHYEDERRRNSRRNDDTRSANRGSSHSSIRLGDHSSQVRDTRQWRLHSGGTQDDFSRSETSGNNYRGDRHHRDRSPLGRSRRFEERRENQAQYRSSGITLGSSSSQYYNRRQSKRRQNRDLLTPHAGGRHPPQETSVRRDLDSENIVYRRQQEEHQPSGRDHLNESTGQTHSDNRLCLYCGNGLLDDQEGTENEGYHVECVSNHKPSCAEAAKLFRAISKNKHVLSFAINVKFLYGSNEADQNKKKKREKRNTKLHEFVDKVSAIRNSNSGFLLVHLVGLNPGDNFTGAFDEFADIKLNELITDGSLFADVYKKKRLSDFPKKELKPFTDILVLCVEGAKFLITSDFKTKLALDDCIVDVKEQNLLKFLQERRPVKEKRFYEFRAEHAEDLCDLQESRHIQTKACLLKRKGYIVLVDHIFDDLRLSEYISAFSKNNSGGSYLLGLAEEQIDKGYLTKILNVTPVQIDNCEEVERRIRERVSATCLVCDYDGIEDVTPDLVKIFFIPTRDRVGYVIHTSVRSVSGIVFYDKGGPLAYRVNQEASETNPIERLTVSEWFKALREHTEDKEKPRKD